jgi:hypothetical protein
MADLWRRGMGPCARTVEPGHRCVGPVKGHHALTRQTLRNRGLAEFEWDRRNRVPLCEQAHLSHHTRSQPLSRGLLPASVFQFADELGLGWLLDKVYPEAVPPSGL